MKLFGKKKKIAGFTLLELQTTIIVLSIALPSIAALYSVALKTDADSTMETQANFLANALMNEISHRRFQQSVAYPGNGPEAGEVNGYDRRGFNDIDDYKQFQTWGPVNPPKDESGAVIPNSAQFSQIVDVNNVPAPDVNANARTLSTVAQGTTNYKLVTVSITWGKPTRTLTLSKLFAKP